MATGVNNFLQCSMCLLQYKEPKGLPCLHAFCLECLQIYIAARPATGSFPCPQCNQNTVIPRHDVRYFPSYFMITNMIPYVEHNSENAGEEIGDTLSQEDCGCGDPVSLCKLCSLWLCKSCTRVHKKLKATASRALISDKDVTKSCKHLSQKWKRFIHTLKENMTSRADALKSEAHQLEDNTLTIAESINSSANAFVESIERSRRQLLSENEVFKAKSSEILVGWMVEVDDKIAVLVSQETVLNKVDTSKSGFANQNLIRSVVADLPTRDFFVS